MVLPGTQFAASNKENHGQEAPPSRSSHDQFNMRHSEPEQVSKQLPGRFDEFLKERNSRRTNTPGVGLSSRPQRQQNGGKPLKYICSADQNSQKKKEKTISIWPDEEYQGNICCFQNKRGNGGDIDLDTHLKGKRRKTLRQPSQPEETPLCFSDENINMNILKGKQIRVAGNVPNRIELIATAAYLGAIVVVGAFHEADILVIATPSHNQPLPLAIHDVEIWTSEVFDKHTAIVKQQKIGPTGKTTLPKNYDRLQNYNFEDTAELQQRNLVLEEQVQEAKDIAKSERFYRTAAEVNLENLKDQLQELQKTTDSLKKKLDVLKAEKFYHAMAEATSSCL